jgi:hypothetical protein
VTLASRYGCLSHPLGRLLRLTSVRSRSRLRNLPATMRASLRRSAYQRELRKGTAQSTESTGTDCHGPRAVGPGSESASDSDPSSLSSEGPYPKYLPSSCRPSSSSVMMIRVEHHLQCARRGPAGRQISSHSAPCCAAGEPRFAGLAGWLGWLSSSSQCSSMSSGLSIKVCSDSAARRR